MRIKTCFFSLLLFIWSLMVNAEPLKDFVYSSREGYSWNCVTTREEEGYRVHLLDLRTQHWREEIEVDRTEWQHWLTIIEPKNVAQNTAFLYIGGGMNGDEPQVPANAVLVNLSLATRSVVAELKMVPNQSLHFADEPNATYSATGRKEDQLMAYSWDRYLRTGDPHWIVSLPMTRAVVRALDAVQEATETPIDSFVISGASKRGWTAWLAAAIDKRVKGVVPICIDLLNIRESMQHHYEAYGQWSYALHDYLEMEIPERWHTAEFANLLSLIDPYEFRDEVSVPKYIINSTGDQFFLPDSSRLYFAQLPGQKWLRYVPNCDHRVLNASVAQGMTAFHSRLLDEKALPSVQWHVDEDQLYVTSDEESVKAVLWTAENTTARDFRLSEVGPIWQASTLIAPITVALQTAETGWRAYLVELTFEDGFVCTTDVFVVPEVLPFTFSDRSPP